MQSLRRLTWSFAREPGLLLARLGQDAAALYRETRRAVLDHHQHSVGVDVDDPRHGGSDFRCETAGFVLRMTGPHPAVNQNRVRRYAVGVNPSAGQLVENDVDVGAGYVIDLCMD